MLPKSLGLHKVGERLHAAVITTATALEVILGLDKTLLGKVYLETGLIQVVGSLSQFEVHLLDLVLLVERGALGLQFGSLDLVMAFVGVIQRDLDIEHYTE